VNQEMCTSESKDVIASGKDVSECQEVIFK
jgi:hypothetical protein